MPSQRTPGRRWHGAKGAEASCASSSWPSGFMQVRAVPVTVKLTGAVGPDQKAGCLGNAPLPGEEGESKWFFSCLPADTPLSRLVELSHLRWPVEQFYEDGKGECGLDEYQGRSWEGLHRHLALVMLTYTFLMLQSLRQEEPADLARGRTF